jgi:hypothetical protein
MFEVDSDKYPPGTIGLVFKTGWKRGDTLLRPCGVGVVRKKPEQQSQQTQSQEQHTQSQSQSQQAQPQSQQTQQPKN